MPARKIMKLHLFGIARMKEKNEYNEQYKNHGNKAGCRYPAYSNPVIL